MSTQQLFRFFFFFARWVFGLNRTMIGSRWLVEAGRGKELSDWLAGSLPLFEKGARAPTLVRLSKEGLVLEKRDCYILLLFCSFPHSSPYLSSLGVIVVVGNEQCASAM